MDESSKYSDADMAMTKEVSPLDSILSMNQERIMAIEKQVEVLAKRLSPVSSVEPERNETSADRAANRGNSALIETLGGQGNTLSSISDRLSRITRNLEI